MHTFTSHCAVAAVVVVDGERMTHPGWMIIVVGVFYTATDESCLGGTYVFDRHVDIVRFFSLCKYVELKFHLLIRNRVTVKYIPLL